MEITPILTSVGVLMLMLMATYLRHYGLSHFRAFYWDVVLLARIRKTLKMDAQEHAVLFEFVKEQRIFNGEVRNFMKTSMDEIKTIKRGMYGDSANGVKGLIQRQEEDEAKIKKLEGFRNRMIWFGSGIVIGLQAIVEFFKFKSK